jgi:site-specific recombinase XerD
MKVLRGGSASHCKEFYLPDRRNLHHQRYCSEVFLSQVTALRSFFRFAQLQEVIKLDLEALVPFVPSWEMSGPPKHLQSEAVQRALSACDPSTAKGKRDYAILRLFGTTRSAGWGNRPSTARRY